MAAREDALAAFLRHDRRLVGAALAAVTALAWAFLARLASMDMAMDGMDMPGMDMAGLVGATAPALRAWTRADVAFTLAMWVVMMVGMMLPSATPMILIYARVGRQAALERQPFAATGWFVGGYLALWAAFSAAATGLQWGLERALLLAPPSARASAVLGGAVFLAAGAYQWSAAKDVCLAECQAPLAFLARRGGFRRDPLGSFRLGAAHGAYCVGCCWALMSLLFVGGVMNVLWIAGLTALVLLEKLVPRGRIVARWAGVALMIGGGLLVAGGGAGAATHPASAAIMSR